ncbi:MAG TPA: exosortase/archaeosortase family protein [Patescibacteria group bacterium]|nr:exosortase/archaeosortase family protein [Patescibacteria group bacterium]
MNQKRTFQIIFIFLALLLVLLPFVTTFNSVLTSLINQIGWYKKLQEFAVPFEARFIVIVLRFIGIPSYLAQPGDTMSFYVLKEYEYWPVQLQWNCLGWQSLLLLTISFLAGLQGNFSLRSKIECIFIGVLGTFLVNIARMVFITAGVYYVNTIFANLIHDYFAALTTIIWLLLFWWFSYSYVLETKETRRV